MSLTEEALREMLLSLKNQLNQVTAERDAALADQHAMNLISGEMLALRIRERDDALARLKSAEAQIEHVVAIADYQRQWTWERGCGDNSCLFRTERKGVGTNGGCRCSDNPWAAEHIFRKLRSNIAKLVTLGDAMANTCELNDLSNEGGQQEINEWRDGTKDIIKRPGAKS